MTHAQLKRMEAGRRRKQREQQRGAIARVVAFERWLAAGSVLRQIPCLPTDVDYAIARAAGKTRDSRPRK